MGSVIRNRGKNSQSRFGRVSKLKNRLKFYVHVHMLLRSVRKHRRNMQSRTNETLEDNVRLKLNVVEHSNV